MDTRPKIVSPESIRRGISKKVVVGYFDPLFADNVIRLNEISAGERISVVVVDRADALLPLHARGELVAALSCVEQVVVCSDGQAPQILSQLDAIAIFDEREADEHRATTLSAHIVERYKPE